MKNMRHKNVVKFYESLETENHYLFFMEACEAGDLLQYVRRRRKIPEYTARHIFKQIVLGLGYIHKQNIVHRDIKLENILIDSAGNVKIADFGISAHLPPGSKPLRDRCGSLLYMAPEMIRNQNQRSSSLSIVNANIKPKYDYRVDIWSLGVVLYVMIYG